MQTRKELARAAGAVAMALGLAACAAPGPETGQHQHAGGPQSGANTASAPGGMGMDQHAMCEMHRKMKAEQAAAGSGGTRSGAPETAHPPAPMMDQRCQ